MRRINQAQARREAFYRISETCPAVRAEIGRVIREYLKGTDQLIENADIDYLTDHLADEAFDAVLSKGTGPLRDALLDCESERIEVQEKLADAEEALATANDQILELQRDIKNLENQVSSLEDQLASAG